MASLLLSMDGKILLSNLSSQEMFGYDLSEFNTLNIHHLFPDQLHFDFPYFIMEHLLQKGKYCGDLSGKRRSGDSFPVEIQIYLERTANEGLILCYIQDVSRHARLNEKLRQLQKIESLGKLTGGILHDFNNMLMIMLNTSALLKYKFPSNLEVQSDLDDLIKTGDQAANLTRKLQIFSNYKTNSNKLVEINLLIKGMKKILQNILGEEIDFNLRLLEEECYILADAGQMEQLLVNLVLNARNALPKGGEVTIVTQIETFDENMSSQLLTRKSDDSGKYVMISVIDDGIGMDKETSSKAFEAFHSSKAGEVGAGLGLFMVSEIVRQHKGYIRMNSELGHGTKFNIFLPLKIGVEKEADEHLKANSFETGSETILLVDDNPAVRKITGKMLRQLNYSPLEAADGREALDLTKKHDGDLHLLLTDIVMPDIDGKRLAEEMCCQRPDLKVIFFSGYSENYLSSRGLLSEGSNFINKPFNIHALSSTIRQVFNSTN